MLVSLLYCAILSCTEAYAFSHPERQDGRTPLHLAAYAGAVEALKLLIADSRVDTSVSDEQGEDALCSAARSLVAAGVEALLSSTSWSSASRRKAEEVVSAFEVVAARLKSLMSGATGGFRKEDGEYIRSTLEARNVDRWLPRLFSSLSSDEEQDLDASAALDDAIKEDFIGRVEEVGMAMGGEEGGERKEGGGNSGRKQQAEEEEKWNSVGGEDSEVNVQFRIA